jgi:hypothetical protein
MYCGQKLRDSAGSHGTPPPTEMRTTSFVPFSESPEEEEEPPPTAVGGYRLVRRIGAGGMGTVYEAEVADSSQRVAVKVLSSRLASSPTSVERFRQEGRLASQLVHPRCVFVVTADTDAGRPYIVMELMPGRTLKDVVDRTGGIAPSEAIVHILDVIDGLAEAHRLGVLHRDVKPSNCFLTADGRVKVGDFGLSKSLGGSQDQQLTQTGAFLGTVLFASPEQIRGEPLDYASDVYSVCATLYYLLCGEAPYQHESVTAALAKAISEPPPSLCDRCPAVSRALERVVMKGLERDRDRRWQSLGELRDALVDLLPAHRTPARPRALVGAFLVDWLVLVLITIVPLEILRSALGWSHIAIAGMTIDPVAWALAVAYFATLEGIFGQTVGKALLGLRVSRVGEAGTPGLGRGWIRALVFIGLWLIVLVAAPVAGRMVGRLAGAGVFAIGAAVLLIQLRRSPGGYRGLHDFASGCHVTQRPFPARKLRLVGRGATALDNPQPASPDQPLPESVGGFAVRGRLGPMAGEEVWVAEDRVLGRRILVWLRPTDAGPIPHATAELVRPTRLRRLGHGRLAWAGKEFEWAAFAAPVGVSLADTIRPERPLPWADARIVLEQLVDELQAAEMDGSMPAELGIDQVWVEPGGRVQLLDVPMRNRGGKSSPFALLRDVAVLTLEGRLRGSEGRNGIHAPVPPHAVPILKKLFSSDGYESLAAFHRDLVDSRAHPPEVTASIRTAQLSIQAAMLGVGLFLMFAGSGIVGVLLVKLAEMRTETAERTLAALRTPDGHARLKQKTGLHAEIDDPAVVERIQQLMVEKRREAQYRRAVLLGPERLALEEFDKAFDMRPRRGELNPFAAKALLTWASSEEGSDSSSSPWDPEAGPVWVVLFLFPLLWVGSAAALRGGISMILTGIALVRADGRKAARWQCALRAAAVWLPVAGLLLASVWLQVFRPEKVYLYVSLWFVALALLPVYVVIALRYPSRPPQDRIAGTFLVPA